MTSTIACVNDLQSKSTRNALVVELVGVITHSSEGEYTPQGTVGCFSKRVAFLTPYYGILALIESFGEESKETRLYSGLGTVRTLAQVCGYLSLTQR